MIWIVSWAIVAFGMPQLVPLLGPVAALLGYALFFTLLLNEKSYKRRFILGFFWYAAVQGVQLFWSLGHPFYYIYAAYLLHLGLLGIQFGLFSILITRENLSRFSTLFALAGIWVLLEWGRLYFLSGHPWNPIGLSLSSSEYARQFASIGGVYGLSFIVMLTNLLWVNRKAIAAAVFLVPFLFGAYAIASHSSAMEEAPVKQIALVQTAFPNEEMLRGNYFEIAQGEWEEILGLLHAGGVAGADLIVLPELVVPFGAYGFAYDYDAVQKSFQRELGVDAPRPQLSHLATKVDGKWKVSNAYWCQAIADHFGIDLIAGLEDSGRGGTHYTTASFFTPGGADIPRYEKRVLAPMGEYIPFNFLRDLAASYGVVGTFEPGQEAKVFTTKAGECGLSICYEENFGHLMRENKGKGAEILVNLTNDNWFPGYGLSKCHFEHARLRTVEMGIPLVRSCNTGITAAVDSLGRDIAIFSEGSETAKGVLVAEVPAYHYETLYAGFGDSLVLILSLFSLLGLWKLRL